MTNAWGSMVVLMCGSILQISSTIYLWQHLLKAKFFVSMEDWALRLIRLIMSESWRKFSYWNFSWVERDARNGKIEQKFAKFVPKSVIVSSKIVNFCVIRLDRFQEVPHEGPMCDLLWSDPDDRSGIIFDWRQVMTNHEKNQNECFQGPDCTFFHDVSSLVVPQN